MFGNKADKSNTGQEEVTAQVNQDLIVRNMPSAARLSAGSSIAADVPSSDNGAALSTLSAPQHNFKLVGLVIIVGGFLFVGGLVYLSYIYIIKPQAKPVAQNSVTTAAPVQEKVNDVVPAVATSAAPIEIATTSLVSTSESANLNLASSSASSSLAIDIATGQNIDVPPLIDSDKDGLNDDEEAVFGTNPNAADSNGNGYTDLVEINNNYNPAGKGKLATNANLTKYNNKTFGYEVLYPKAWKVSSIGKDSTITFTAPDNSIMQISVQDNSDHQSILGWYGSSFPELVITYEKLKALDNWDGIMGDDNLNFYLTDKKKTNIYVISYIPNNPARLAYPNVFKAMINSFLIK